MTPSEFVQQLVNALSLGSIYALLALVLAFEAWSAALRRRFVA